MGGGEKGVFPQLQPLRMLGADPRISSKCLCANPANPSDLSLAVCAPLIGPGEPSAPLLSQLRFPGAFPALISGLSESPPPRVCLDFGVLGTVPFLIGVPIKEQNVARSGPSESRLQPRVHRNVQGITVCESESFEKIMLVPL